MTKKPLRVEDIADETWRLYPHTYAQRMSKGKWKAYRHLVYISKIIRSAIIKGGGRILVNAPPRHGKAIENHTLTPTTDGWKKHGDLKPGDQVFGLDGHPTTVVSISDPVRMEYEVELSNGEVIICHGNHEWTIWDRAAKRWRTVETSWFLRTTTRGPLAGHQKDLWTGTPGVRGARMVYQLPLVPALQCPETELPIDPYVLGVWLGDGSSGSPYVTMLQADAQHVLPSFEKAGYELTGTVVHSATGIPTYRFSSGIERVSGPLTKALVRAGVFKNKHVPSLYFRASIPQRLELLAGMIDTDGHVEPETGRVRIVTTSERLRDGMFELAASLGFRPYITQQQPTLSSSGIQGTKVVFTVAFQPTWPIPTRIPRKRIARIAAQRRVGIASVRPLTERKVGRCIQVDRPDGMYLVGRTLIPTHNSQLISQWVPSWYLAMFPEKNVILASYEASLAEDFGRQVRDHFMNAGERWTEVREDAAAARRWLTPQGGSMLTSGVGGPLAGRGGNLILGDDFYRNLDDANSVTYQRRLRDWFNSTLYTRAERDTTMVLVNCLATGTRVLSVSGWKNIEQLIPGEQVWSYPAVAPKVAQQPKIFVVHDAVAIR